MPTVSDSPISLINSEGERFAKLGRFLRDTVDNANIAYTAGGYLRDIQIGDSEGVRFATLGAWLQLLAENIGDVVPSPGTSGVDPTTRTLAQLAAIPMVGKTLPVVKVWVETSTLTAQIWQALLGSDASGDGVQRADDWATSGVVWYRRL